MKKLKFLLQIYIVTWTLQLTSCRRLYKEEVANLTLWPDLRCHEGYLMEEQPGKENGEEALIAMIFHCGDKQQFCHKRCILQYMRVLEFDRFEFRSEDIIGTYLTRDLFTDHPQTGARLAKQLIVNGCQPLLTTLANAESKPSCEDQEEFFDCVETAMRCQ